MDRLFLIDGHSLIFRMYYAFLRRPMVNSRGEDVSILYGFTKYLLELLKRQKPSHVAVMFDPPAKTFRHELAADYKANRGAAPELVKEALEPLEKIVKSLGIEVIMKPGFEADDAIGSAARAFASPATQVYMVTPDKDLGQIVDDNIFQYKPGKAGAEDEILSRQDICDKYGFDTPLQVIDFLTLCGDASDNVHGVSGVGEVGAKKLIAKYKSVENIYAHLDELTPRMRAQFEEARGHIALSKTLVTIKTDVPLGVSLDDLKLKGADGAQISEIIDRYEFGSLKALLPDVEFKEKEHKTLECKELAYSEIVAMAKARGAVAVIAGTPYIICVEDKWCACDESEAGILLDDAAIVKIGHSMKNIPARGAVHDVELMHYLVNPERTHKLEILAQSYLDIDLSRRTSPEAVAAPAPVQELDLFSAAAAPATVAPKEDLEARVRSCAALWKLEPLLRKELEDSGMWKLYREVEMPLLEVLRDVEAAGVRLDTAQLRSYSRDLTAELAEIERQAREAADSPLLNLSSPKQVGEVIYDYLALDPKARKKSTDEETLRALEDRHPFIGLLLEYRALKKLLSTYIDPLPELVNPSTGRIHTTFNQALTATGRLSSVRPNLQNIPIRTERGGRIREAFVPTDPAGCIVSADYSQIELRLMAHLSGDAALVEAFIQGEDVHRATAARIYGKALEDVLPEERRHAKVANFGIIYGISAFGLAQRMEIPLRSAKAFIEEYFRSYPEVRAYMESTIALAREKGFSETIFGRRRYLPDINSRNQMVRGLAERNAINAPIQGSAADIIKLAMTAVWRRMRREGLRSRMVLQVHDELVFDVVPGEAPVLMALVKEEMEGVASLKVPLIVECNAGKNWKEAH